MSQSISLMALHESRKKRLLKLFRRAKRNDEPESNTTSEKATGNNGKQRDALAISSSQDRNIGQAFLPSHGIGSQSEYTLPRNDLATPHIAKYRLPHVPCEREFSSSFRGLTLNSHKDEHEPEVNGDGFDEGRNSEYIADRNMSTASLDTPSIRLLPQKRELSQSKSQPLIPHVDRHSGNVADWNIVRNDNPTMEAQSDAPPPLKVHKRNSHLSEVFHSQEGPDTRDVPRGEAPGKRDASWSITPLAMEGSPSYLDVDGQKNPKARDTSWTITPLAMEGDSNKDPFENTSNTPSLEFPRPSLDKPLPPTPSTIAPRTPTSAKTTTGGFPNSGKIPAHAKQDSAGPMDLDDAEVRRFPDTVSLHEEQAPAVEHEKIIEKQHEVRQNVITREVHDHDIYHRILPIKDIEVKPARHFVPVQDGYVEVDEDDLPGRTRQRTNWAIAELVSKSTPDTQGAVSARHFTARKFSGTDGDDKEYIGPDGYPVKEKTWVHPPTLEQNTQGTHAFHFGSKDPKNDGLKAKLPAGNIVGVSKRLMERRSRMDIDS